MNNRLHKSRREFLRSAAIGGALLLGWPRRLSWAVEPSPGTKNLTMVYYVDLHARVEWETPLALRMAAHAINEHHPELVLCGGDMITDGYNATAATAAPRWDVYMEMHRAITPAPEPALGNHDLVGVEPEDGSIPSEDPRADWRERMGLAQTYRSFQRHGYQFIILDSVQITRDELKYRGYIDEAQMAWLRAELAAINPEMPIILMTHMPLLTSFFQRTEGSGAGIPPNRGIVNNREVLDAFAGHRLLAVLQGHTHVNEMIRWGDTTFITGGAVCGRWWRGNWHGTPEGFGVLRLHPDRVDWSYHTYGWQARRPEGV